MSEWIWVEDELPKHQESVLGYTDKGQCVCIFIDTKEMNKKLTENGYSHEAWNEQTKPYSFASQERHGLILNGVTHWMPLPEMPDERY